MTQRRVLVLGATGGTGRLLVAEALRCGCSVTALVRHPQSPAIGSDRLRIVTGNILSDDGALADAMRDQDVVISALGVGKGFKSGSLIAQSMPRIVREMQHHGVRRLIVTSAFGVGETYRDAPAIPRIFIRTLLRDVYRDKEAGEAQVRISDLDWTVVHPTGLTDGPATGRYRVGERLMLRGFPRVSRADVAHFLMSQTDDASFVRKSVLISS